jgi:uncharacterized heparinase superfamily protein
MALTDDVPAFKVGSPDLGGQLRELARIVKVLCEAEEARLEAAEAATAAATTKPASKPVTRAAAK